MVDKWTAPNNTTQTASAYKANIDNGTSLNNLVSGDYFVHAQDTPDMTVKASAGTRLLGQALTVDAAQNTGTITAPVTNPRIDRVVLDLTGGTVSVVTGAESTVPVAPSITANTLPLCQIALTTSTTSITNSDITDERTLIGTKPVVAFRAYNSADDSNVTGAGTNVTIDFDTEDFDYGSNFASDVFTAPVAGLYYIGTEVRVKGVTAAMIRGEINIEKNGTAVSTHRNDIGAVAGTNGNATMKTSGIFVLAASDTIDISVTIFNGAGDTADISGNTAHTWIEGYLIS